MSGSRNGQAQKENEQQLQKWVLQSEYLGLGDLYSLLGELGELE